MACSLFDRWDLCIFTTDICNKWRKVQYADVEGRERWVVDSFDGLCGRLPTL
jgi:hypothetical protein